MFLFQNQLISKTEFWRKVSFQADILRQSDKPYYILYSEDCYEFAIKFFALIEIKKTIILPPNNQNKILNNFEDKLKDLPNSKIIFYTSGSTGESKLIVKDFMNLQIEIQELKKLWGNCLNDSIFLSTVSHQHIYGLLFRLLLPMALENTIIDCTITNTQEELIKKIQVSKNHTLITSPAFIKRFEPNLKISSFAKIQYCFSSGGVLKPEIINNIKPVCQNLIEILGSTETGGIAYKKPTESNIWTLFPLVQIKKQNTLSVKSAYILDKNYIETGDTIEFLSEKHFLLKERTDSIVKIEEKRVSLIEIENKLLKHEYIKDCSACVLEANRQIIAIVAVLSVSGLKYLELNNKFSLNYLLRKYLLDYFEPVLLPRKWRYLDRLPFNSQGKLNKKEIYNLFS